MFRSLTIEAFRGFNEPQTLQLDASVVILRGPNGTGKTSFFDAIQWLLLGEIDRLKALRDQRDTEHLVNRYRLPGPALVTAELSLGGQTAVVSRSGTYRGSQLTVELAGAVLEGAEADLALRRLLLPHGDTDIGAVLLTSGLLQQDVMRSLLEARPGDRFAALSRLLRLGVLEDFQKATSRASARAAERTAAARATVAARQRERDRHEQQAADAATAASHESRVAQASERFRTASASMEQFASSFDVPASAQGATAIARQARGVRRRGDELLREWNALEASPPTIPPTDGDVRAAHQAANEAELRVQDAKSDHDRASEVLRAADAAAADFARLAAIAIPLLTDECPVCGQSIDAESTEERLRHLAQASPILIEAQGRVREISERLSQHEQELAVAQERVRRIDEAQRATQERAERRAALGAEMRRLVVGDVHVAESASVSDLPSVFDGLRLLEEAAEELATALSTSELAALAATATTAAAAAREAADEARAELERAASIEADFANLVKATKAARVEVTESRYSRIRPVVRELFNRLDAHRAFTELDLKPVLYGKAGTTVMPTARDPERDLSASPALVYSSAQANVAALAYFIALSWGAEDHALPFVMLDDPLQSMDDVNVLAFADLCRFMRRRRQLFLSTHERRFADLLERKLAPRQSSDRTIALDFGGWDRRGPSVVERVLPEAPDYEPDAYLRWRRGRPTVSG